LNDDNVNADYSHFPFNIFLNGADIKQSKLKTEEPANFIIRKNNEVKFAVVNGFLIDISQPDRWEGNSIIYKNK